MSKLLKKIEKRIEANYKSVWYENNLLLLKIKNENLYKKKYKNFESYLEEKMSPNSSPLETFQNQFCQSQRGRFARW